MTKANEQSRVPPDRDDFLMIALGAALSSALPMLVSIPKEEAILVGWTIAFSVGYFIPPRPEVKFVLWMVERMILITCFYLFVFKIPLLFKSKLATPFAYGIPIIIFLAGFIMWIRYRTLNRPRA